MSEEAEGIKQVECGESPGPPPGLSIFRAPQHSPCLWQDTGLEVSQVPGLYLGDLCSVPGGSPGQGV